MTLAVHNQAMSSETQQLTFEERHNRITLAPSKVVYGQNPYATGQKHWRNNYLEPFQCKRRNVLPHVINKRLMTNYTRYIYLCQALNRGTQEYMSMFWCARDWRNHELFAIISAIWWWYLLDSCIVYHCSMFDQLWSFGMHAGTGVICLEAFEDPSW